MKRELVRARRNIYVSRAISRLKGKSSEYREFLEIFSSKYDEKTVKATLRDLYTFNREIKDIKSLTVALIRKNYHL